MDQKVIAALLCMALAGCAMPPTGNLCTAGPFIPDPGVSERWTRPEKEQLVTLNNAGRDICGWRAPGEGGE